MSNRLLGMRKEILKEPDVLIYYESLIRDLIRVREKFGMEWDDDMEEIMRTRDEIYEEIEQEKNVDKEPEENELEQAMNLLEGDLTDDI